MYSKNPVKDGLLIAKAILSNQYARIAPASYVRFTEQTGRGGGQSGVDEIAGYFLESFGDYSKRFGRGGSDLAAFLEGKRVLEYGPGDILGVALLMYAHGAESVECVDRFPLSQNSEKNLAVYRAILNSLEGGARERAARAFRVHGKPESGFDENAIQYRVTRDGFSGAKAHYDLIISRAVLEHVNDLEGTIADIKNCLKPGGLSAHLVDLSSHGLDRYRALDFLTWPELLYRLMYSEKGYPNRHRIDKYRQTVRDGELEFVSLTPQKVLDPVSVEAIAPYVAKSFRSTSKDDLAWLSFWMVLRHAGNSA